MQTSELLTIIGWAVAWGAVIGAASLLILKPLRRASFAVQICVVVLAAMAVLTAGNGQRLQRHVHLGTGP